MMLHHHDQSKMSLNNDSMYHSDSRYTIDGMIDELLISGSESLNDLSHLELPFNNKSSNSSNSSGLMTNEDYLNHLSFNQMSHNMNMNNFNVNNSNNSNLVANTNNSNNYHSMQIPMHLQPNNQVYGHQYLPPSTNITMHNSTSYITLGSSGLISSNNNNANNNNGPIIMYNNNETPTGNIQYATASKIISRTPSFSSSSTSPSSSSSSLSSLSVQHHMNQQTHLNTMDHSISNEHLDYDQASIDTSVSQVNDPAEQARLKQMRGLKLTPEEIQLLVKDRQRKDNHNMIERRRRFNINDRIKELGQLLPKNGEFDTKQNKGSILKASVDYIMQVKTDMDEAKKVQESNKYLISINKKLVNRIKELELLCHSHGISGVNCQFNNASNPNFSYPQMNNKFYDQQQQLNNMEQQSAQINSTTSPNNINSMINTSNLNDTKNPNSFNFTNKIYSNTPITELTIHHNNNNNTNNVNVSQIISETISNNMSLIDTNEMFKENLLNTKLFNDTDNENDSKPPQNNESVLFSSCGKTVKECITAVNINGGTDLVAKKSKYVRKRDIQTDSNVSIKRNKKDTKSLDKEIKLLKEEPISPKNNNLVSEPLIQSKPQTQHQLSSTSSTATESRSQTPSSSSLHLEPTFTDSTQKETNDNNPSNENETESIAQKILNTQNASNSNSNNNINDTGTINATKLQNTSKFIITKTSNRINPLMVTNKVNLNTTVELLSSPSITSSSPIISTSAKSFAPTSIVKLMTSHSKDPTLSSSSISSPTQMISSSISSSPINNNLNLSTSPRTSTNNECQSCL